VTRFGQRTIVWVQNPLALLRQASEFPPDGALLTPRPDFYRYNQVEPGDAFLVIEVMESSVEARSACEAADLCEAVTCRRCGR
jgi:hypothetical protein